ncbi:MAG: FHA domain-containing protein [Alphaproteobacteria bacterium]
MATPARLSIGRGSGNDIVVDHASVSRKHAEMLRNEDGSFDIFDHASSVGTFALHEGRWVQFEHATVGPDETIRLGEFETTANMLMSAYRDPYDRTTQRGDKPKPTRREAERRLSGDAPAGPPNPQPPPGALQADAFRPPETARPPTAPQTASRPETTSETTSRPGASAAPPPTVPDAPPMPATPTAVAARQSATPADPAPSMLVAYLLWFFLGVLGAHRVYLRAYVSGAIQALMFVSAIATMLVLMWLDLETAGVLIGTVPLTLLGLWWVVDAFLTYDMVKKRGGGV